MFGYDTSTKDLNKELQRKHVPTVWPYDLIKIHYIIIETSMQNILELHKES